MVAGLEARVKRVRRKEIVAVVGGGGVCSWGFRWWWWWWKRGGGEGFMYSRQTYSVAVCKVRWKWL